MTREARNRENAHCELAGESAGRRGCVNCCIAGFMSRCGAGPLLEDQVGCMYFRKSSIANRCMHYCVSLDGHCDCVEAQQELKSRSRSQD